MKARLAVLVALLVGVGLAALMRIDWSGVYPAQLLSRPSQCSHPDARFQRAVAKLEQFALPGFQLSYRHASNAQVNCVSGWADAFSGKPVRYDHRFRYASLTKVFTSNVVRQLVREGRLSLDDRLVEVLALATPLGDARTAHIRIVDLLQHSAGFDRKISGDPMFATNVWCPGELAELMSLKLDYDPGTRYAYSNLGYCLLGAVIEHVEGRPVEEVFQQRIFAPAQVSGVELARKGVLGEGEVKIYPRPRAGLASVMALDYVNFVAVGGWTGSADEFNQAIGQLLATGHGFFDLATFEGDQFGVCQRHVLRSCHGQVFYTHEALGGQAMYWRDGSLPGVSSVFALFADGSSVVFLANGRRTGVGPNNEIVEAIYELFGRGSRAHH